IRVKSEFGFLAFKSDKGYLYWTTRGELGEGKFFVEMKLNEHWVMMKTVRGKGEGEINKYQAEVDHALGISTYRIKYIDPNSNIFYSDVITHQSDEQPVTFYPERVEDKITLSREVPYTIEDAFGNVVLSGTGSEIKVPGLATGVYYLNIANRTERFFKK
ncbi:MAG: T9SS C-terminal target domain-containing protein, partial [Cytophagales bacterium]|nr:T9SS C-terminal target domain-containing protein [Cytophagales bacterium]